MTALPQALGRSRARPRRGVSGKTGKFTLNSLGVIVALVTLFPIFWMVSTAFKPPSELFSLTPHPLPLHPTLHNFSEVMNGHAAGLGISFWTFARNSLLVTVVTVVLASLVSLLAAVAVARFRFRFRVSILIMLLVVQMLPAQAMVIPLFVDFRGIGLLDSLVGLILIYSAQALPISIWLLRNFVTAVPRDLEEAAAIDGAGAWTVFWRILLPLVSPGLVSTSVFAFIFAYNEFIFALTFLGTDTSKFTLPLYVQYFYGQNSTDWGAIMASSTLFTIPVLLFFFLVQRRLASGLVAGAVKG